MDIEQAAISVRLQNCTRDVPGSSASRLLAILRVPLFFLCASKFFPIYYVQRFYGPLPILAYSPFVIVFPSLSTLITSEVETLK
jgi:hypothetical protein